MDTLQQDIRYALRRLRQAPAFAAIVIGTLALGVGANTTMFGIVNGVLLRPLPYRDPERLVQVDHFYPSLNDLKAGVSVPGFYDYQDRPGIFASSGVVGGWMPTLTGQGDPRRLRGARVSARYFQTLGVGAVVGRAFVDDEGEAGRNSVVVLSNGTWKRLFGGARDAVGRTITIDATPMQIVGVLPEGFIDVACRDCEIWAPYAFTPEQRGDDRRTSEFLSFVGRLKPGVTQEHAQSVMHELATRLKQEHPSTYSQDWTLLVTPLAERRTANIRAVLVVLLGAVGFVLLIACANVANLLLARGAGRSKEVAIRAALGAARVRIVRQLLTESVVLAMAGGLAGLVLAALGMRAVAAFHPANLPRGDQVGLDGSVLVFCLVASLVTGVLFGLAPALQASRSDLNETLKEGGRQASGERTGQRTRRVLVVSEMALALVLLAGAGLLLRSFDQLVKVDPGFRPAGLITAEISLPRIRYASDTQQIAFYDALLARLSATAGVRSVGVTSVLPFGGNWTTGGFSVEGFQPKQGDPGPWGDIRTVSPSFLGTIEAPLKRGRMFTVQDDASHPKVVVVDEEMVRRYWPHDDPIGKRIYFGNKPDSTPDFIQVVGVVGHTMHEGLDAEKRLQVYLPYAQSAEREMGLVVRADGDPHLLLPAIRAAVQQVDRDVPISNVRTMEQMVDASVGSRRLAVVLLGAFATMAMFLAALGIYGVMSFSVAQRRRDIGLRMALGAERRDVWALVVRQGMVLAGIGVGVGALGAVGVTRLIRSQLYGVSATDPVTFIAATAILAGTALAATWIPATRATRVDPAIALRQE